MIFLGPLRTAVRTASWFAALGEPLTEGDLADARAYVDVQGVDLVASWAEAETFLKSPTASLDWWNHEEAERKALLAEAGTNHPERALWTALSELTTETGDLVHGKAATAAARAGNVAPASIHVAAGAASQAVYQLAVARLAGREASPFESKFRLFAAGRWPLGVAGSRLVLF
ncbi:MAG: hypothetical protein JSR47_17575 [Proteobacteria bacterium]|nr:hypothetical protein [Pseudomonadota bacterium]MBS0547786.1 hypothetical protein [Pseudomonadota bacterium]